MRKLARFADLDPRWLYASLLLVIVLAGFVEAPLTIKPGRETRGFHDAIENADPRKPILLESDWDMGTIGELRAQFYNVVRHLFTNNRRFVIISGNALGSRFYQPAMNELAKEFGKEYGKDWVAFGFKLPDPKAISIEALAKDFPRTAASDDRGKKSTDYEWLKNVKNAGDWALAITINYAELREFITYFTSAYRTPYICGIAAISSTQLYPFISSGTIKGMLVGSRGGAEYEQIMHRYDEGTRFLLGQSAGHLLLILVVILGNIGAIAKRRLPKS